MSKIPRGPILILGAGVSGLLLAQYLRKTGVPFVVFERDADLATRGLGWGLTIHWSLPALRSLLPAELVARLPEAYVDREAVEQGRASTFPFFDLSSGALVAATPKAGDDARIRVARDRFRRLLAAGIDIQWGKAGNKVDTHDDGSVTVHFDDGSACQGMLAVACDGANSRVRKQLLPDLEDKFAIPVRLIGATLEVEQADMEPLRELDPYFLQGTAKENNSYVYLSVLDAPGNADNASGKYTCQIVVSWPIRDGFFGSPAPITVPETDDARMALIKGFAETWAEPFRSLVLGIPPGMEIKSLDLFDWPPPRGLRTSGSVALLGDALHPMAMYRGEGANHAIMDVVDFVDIVMPSLGENTRVQPALDRFEDRVVARTRPAVLASRQACLDAHDWSRISPQSPLLSRRAMHVEFDDGVVS